MRELHHIGIPTEKEQAEESYLEGGKVHITDPEKSPNRIEWLRFEDGSPLPDLLKTMAHIAYKVDDIKAEMAGRDVLLEPFNPAEGVTVAFVMEEGAPIELMHVAG